jgi:hypothetical protein
VGLCVCKEKPLTHTSENSSRYLPPFDFVVLFELTFLFHSSTVYLYFFRENEQLLAMRRARWTLERLEPGVSLSCITGAEPVSPGLQFGRADKAWRLEPSPECYPTLPTGSADHSPPGTCQAPMGHRDHDITSDSCSYISSIHAL